LILQTTKISYNIQEGKEEHMNFDAIGIHYSNLDQKAIEVRIKHHSIKKIHTHKKQAVNSKD